ncbi:hypothetical protein ACFL2K_01045 [Candidatus Margulisiibacteriota bacterium]
MSNRTKIDPSFQILKGPLTLEKLTIDPGLLETPNFIEQGKYKARIFDGSWTYRDYLLGTIGSMSGGYSMLAVKLPDDAGLSRFGIQDSSGNNLLYARSDGQIRMEKGGIYVAPANTYGPSKFGVHGNTVNTDEVISFYSDQSNYEPRAAFGKTSSSMYDWGFSFYASTGYTSFFNLKMKHNGDPSFRGNCYYASTDSGPRYYMNYSEHLAGFGTTAVHVRAYRHTNSSNIFDGMTAFRAELDSNHDNAKGLHATFYNGARNCYGAYVHFNHDSNFRTPATGNRGYYAYCGGWGTQDYIAFHSSYHYDTTTNYHILGYNGYFSNTTFYVTAGYTSNLFINGNISKGSGAFDIKHPDPDKATQDIHLRHAFVETPSAGGSIYKFQIDCVEGENELILPDYFKFLNSDVIVYVVPFKHFGAGYGEYNEADKCLITVTQAGKYNILIFGDRKDTVAMEAFNKYGNEYIRKEIAKGQFEITKIS